MTLRISLATYDDGPPIGGQGVLVCGLRAALHRRGVDVHTVAGRGEYGQRHPALTRRAPLDFSIELNRHPRRLYEGNPALVHAMGGPGGVLLLRRLEVPLVYTANHTYRQAYASSRPQRLLSIAERRAYRAAAKVLPISPSTADAVRALGVPSRRIEVILPGVDVDRFDRGEAKREPERVLFVGRLEWEKGPLDAVRCIRHLAQDRRGLRGVVIGRGALEGAVRNAVDSARRAGVSIDLLGAVSDDELAEQFARATVVIVPSRYEGLGLVALEAMAGGAAVVGTDVTGLRDAVGDRGVLVEPDAPDRLADAVAMLLDHPAQRGELTARAREHVREHHSWDTVGARVMEIYRGVAPAAAG
ncbi:MAG TPA: glycosyltransferase family 4 protein [Candidatus Dormibacteraeota bacterium]|nr:glycosyltransferase family 4 protein [Candidatus Dormibacteraeota bacterium]